MNTVHAGDIAARAIYARARRHCPPPEAVVTLHLGDEAWALAYGTGDQPLHGAVLPLGIQALSERYFPSGRFDELSIERAIAEVEDIVMPWHAQLPKGARLFAQDAAITRLAQWAGWPRQDTPWLLATETVETLFNRWIARIQGRPASQDALPTDAQFSVALLVLRECLHHWGFSGITVLPMASAHADSHEPIQTTPR